MSLTTAELRRIKYELGYNVLASGAEPYIGVHAVFEQVIATYMTGGASTTSATAVTAATTATPVTLTLTSATGFAAGDRVVVDVDDRQETVTVQSLSGTSMVVQLRLTHSGTYPVVQEGGESIVRELLGRLRVVAAQIGDSATSAGIKRVDDVEFFGDGSASQSRDLAALRMRWRDELASLLGVQNLWRVRQSAGSITSLY